MISGGSSDSTTMPTSQNQLVGDVNRDLVSTINRETMDDPVAVGVAGEDGGLLVTTPRDPALGFVGDVSEVRAERLHGLLDQGLAPVVSTIGADASGQPYNINADEAAMAIAVAMKAEKIVYPTAAPGLLEDASDETSLVHRLTSAELRERIEHDSVTAGMIPKLRACADAVDGGVGIRPHHRRPGAARSADRDTDRRGHRHDGEEGRRAGESDLLTIAELGRRRARRDWSLSERTDLGRPLAGKGVALVFQKPSARTRNSTEMAVVQLGGHPVYIQKEEVGLGTRESAEDVARTLACYH